MEFWNHKVKVQDVPISKMFVPADVYQRGVKARPSFDPNEYNEVLAQLLEVAEREDGTYAVIDGQNRMRAAIQCGKDTMPCRVHVGLAVEQEAALFVIFNAKRLSVTPLELHRASVVAGDAEATFLKDITEAHGYEIKTSGINSIPWIKKLQDLHIRYGTDVLDWCLGICAQMDPGKPIPSNVLLGLCDVFDTAQPYRGIPMEKNARQSLLKENFSTVNGKIAMFYKTLSKVREHGTVSGWRARAAGLVVFKIINKHTHTKYPTPTKYKEAHV
jgi:hypothetical protein